MKSRAGDIPTTRLHNLRSRSSVYFYIVAGSAYNAAVLSNWHVWL
jgi:hypothetical protein